MKSRSFAALAASLTAGIALSLGGTALAASDSAASKPIVVGADTTFPPFETEQNGKVTGFDIDMMRDIAKAENLEINFKTLPFNGIIPSLQA